MITITATPDPVTATIDLVVTPTTETVTSIQRRDANGIRPVRMLSGLLPSSGSFATVDAEASLKGPVTYQVVTSAGLGPSTTTALDVDGWQLVDPMLPTYAVSLYLVLGLDANRSSGTTFLEVVGRADPVAVIGPLRLRTGTMDLFCKDYETALELERRYAAQRVLMLRQGTNAGLDLYHLVESTRLAVIDGTGARRWMLSVSYREVLPPTGALLTQVGWTYDDVLATYESYDALMFAFADYNALTLGDPL